MSDDKPSLDAISPEEFAEILALGHETARVEFKPGGLRRGELEGRVIRAILGMANRTGGGVVVLGVEENADKTLKLVGMSQEQLTSWNHDDTTATTSAHADPFVTFTRMVRTTNGMDFVVFKVDEFEELPVLCKKEFAHPTNPKKPILVRGACYVRTRGKPETIDIASQTEMRELLTRSVDKGVARFVQRARAAGVPLVPGEPAPTDDDHFGAQAKDLLANEDVELVDPALAEIRGRGYWEVTIRPTTFDQERMANVVDLEPLLEAMQSRISEGWYFPHLDRSGARISGDHIQESVEFDTVIEFFRFYQSGQFIFFAGFREDWLDRAGMFDSPPPHPKPGEALSIGLVIYRYTNIYELAAHMAQKLPGSDDLRVDVVAYSVGGRRLTTERGRAPLMAEYRADIRDYRDTRRFRREILVAEPRKLAAEAIERLFVQFQWRSVTKETIAGWQEETFGRAK